ncbi:MAG: DUF4062 domain-containing protein [Syntrophales bacterium]
MTTKRKPILMVSSAVFGFEELLDRIYASLAQMNYEIRMSYKGTMPVYPDLTALESCKLAVRECDLFLGIILPRYGSGKEKPEDDSITHDEMREAIRLKKPRWILAHDHVVFARGFLDKLGFTTREKRHKLKLVKSPVFEDLRIVDIYEMATRRDVEVYKDRVGNWVQTFGSPEDAQLFAVSQFRRFQEAEAFVKDTFGNVKVVRKALQKGGPV